MIIIKNNLARIEALIYVTGDQGISEAQLLQITGINSTQLHSLLHKLSQKYQNDADSAFRLLNYAGKYRLATKELFDNDVKQLFAADQTTFLTPAILETLTIVAYNQPITRVEIDDIRGVNSSATLQKLLKYDLIQTAGHKKVPGDPKLYVTTDDFLNVFGLKQIEDLPPMDKLNDRNEHNE